VSNPSVQVTCDWSFSKNNIEFVICGDINVDYLENNRKKAQLNNMLKTYNLTSTVYFPT
jgi:hypothetical protein